MLAGSLLAVLSGLPPAAAPAAGARRATPPAYTNPLTQVTATGAVVDTCPDPSVLRGRGADAGTWFMLCTNAVVLQDGSTGPVRQERRLPVLASRDLVHWELVGPTISAPAWAAPGTRLWAPDVVFSRTHRRYVLTYAVTDTTDAVSGEPDCAHDPAIGVATSASLRGPWRHAADGPLVAPRRLTPGCVFASTIDPDVAGDSVGDRAVLYFGGFRGGIQAQRVGVRRYGLSLEGSAQPLTTGRYEAANVVRRGDYFYLLASAGHCCQGDLSGYGVFAGRSSRPLGPFIDREGRSLLEPRTGGTPVLTGNGGRWVGPGHGSLVTDAAGRWWMAYHGIDQGQPTFPDLPASTRRVPLLDPVDWDAGWPVVRGGRGPSAGPVPGPAAQDGQVSGYRPDWLPDDRPGVLIPEASDEWEGTDLDPRWTWVREPDPSTYHVTGGQLHLETDPRLLWDADGSPVLTHPAPAGDYVVETAVRLAVPPGAVPDHLRAGIVVRADDERYVSLFHGTPDQIQTTEFAKRDAPRPEGLVDRGSMSVGPPGDVTRLRLVRRAGSGHERYTAWTKQGGRAWVRGGTWRHHLGSEVQLGLAAFGASGYTARFDYLRTSTLG